MTLKIDWATHESAKYACENWHYSKCIPKSKLVKIGAWENEKFIGVVIFSYGANQNLGKFFGLSMQECVELTRVALRRHITPVSKILSISLKFLKKMCPNLKMIVSYADLDQNHHGGIYQATNWIYMGKTEVGVKSGYIIKGKKIHPKTIGDRYGTRSIPVIKKIHPDLKMHISKGKHKYIYPLTEEMKEKIIKLSKPYPKRVSSIDSDAVAFQAIEGSANLTDTLHLSEKIDLTVTTAIKEESNG